MLRPDYHSKWLVPLRLLLMPLALLYGSLMQMRNFLFDIGVFKVERFPVPVISIGNLSAGGSGKTPLAIFLARMLQKKYGSVAVVSRGYGRKSSGVHLVSDGLGIHLSADQAGDEPLLIARKAPGVIVVVAEKRAAGIAFVLSKYQPSVILLDDAFQHRAVFRNLDILLLNPADSCLDRQPLPGGFYREFAFNRRRAGMILFTDSLTEKKRRERERGSPSSEIQFKLGELTDLRFESTMSAHALRGKRVGAFAGIAHPQNFLKSLKERGAQIVFFQPFNDHHDFKTEEIERLLLRCQQEKCDFLLCTEKDLVKISAAREKIFAKKEVMILAPALKVEIEKMDLFEKKVSQAIDTR